jgi:hypothetical protein
MAADMIREERLRGSIDQVRRRRAATAAACLAAPPPGLQLQQPAGGAVSGRVLARLSQAVAGRVQPRSEGVGEEQDTQCNPAGTSARGACRCRT